MPGDAVVITVTTTNAGPARSLGSTLTFTLPASLAYVPPQPDTSGCVEAPVGVIECPLAGVLGPGIFQGSAVVRAITETSDGGIGTITAVAATESDETAAADNTASLTLGVNRFRNGFE